MTRKEFEEAVRDAAGSLPKRFRDRLENVEIVVEEGTADGKFLGLYQGIPHTERGTGYSGVLPDKITLFKRAIEAECEANGLDIRQEIARVVRHEIAHHFGIDDGRLEDLGAY
ncbi:MAG: metallopeptidase family protein [Candidatus Omnitrophica bacterium]|nr:metallopeptidase family protein [Candidatus Omnitrophota bacterium]